MRYDVDTNYNVASIEGDDNNSENASELLAEEMVELGEKMMSLGRRLLAQASQMQIVVEEEPKKKAEQPRSQLGERSLSRHGNVVRIDDAIAAAQSLGTAFTFDEFQVRLDLTRGAAMKWLQKLINNKPRPIVVNQVAEPGKPVLYGYNLDTKGKDPTHAPEHAKEVDRMAGVGIMAATSEQVAYTGRTMGSSGKPGLDKKRSQQRRVRRKSGQIIGKK